MKISNIIALGITLGLNCGSYAISPEGLDWGNLNTEYLTRDTMKAILEETVTYITELNKYINKVESRKFVEKANLAYDSFMKSYEEFKKEITQLESDYKTMTLDPTDKDKRSRFESQIKKVDNQFTKTSKQYTSSFRRINRSLTKLDTEKIRYTDAEIFKTYSMISIRSINNLIAVEKMLEITRGRADECGPVDNKDDYYTEAVDDLEKTHGDIETIIDNFPLYIIKEEEYQKVNDDYKEVLKNFDHSVNSLNKFENALGQKYIDRQIKYDKRFQQCIKIIEKLPFRISGFSVPNILVSLLLSLVVITNI